MDATTITLKPIQRFWRLLKPDQHEIRNVYAYAIFNGIINLSLPLGIQAIVNLIQGGQINTSWIVLVTIVVLGVALSGVLQIFQLHIVENLQQRIFTRAAFEFAYRIPRIRMEALYHKYAPELVNRFFDIVSIQKGLSKVLIDFSTAGLQMIFGLLLLSFYHPFFILFSLVLVLFVFIVFRFTAARGLARSIDESTNKYKVAYWLEELARTATTFKLSGQSALLLKKTDSHVNDYLESRQSHFNVLVRQYGFMVIFKVVLVTGLLAIGGILVMEQLMNIGQFVAAEIIVLLIINSVEKLIFSIETIYDVLTGLEKIGQVTDMEMEDEGGEGLKLEHFSKGMSIEFSDVDFTYPGQERPSISNVSLQINQRERVMITGPNSSGKSSLLHLMSGLYASHNGLISFGGYTNRNLTAESIRSITGSNFSHDELFEGSVIENICLGRPDVDMDYVHWLVEKLGIQKTIQSLPEGYDSQLGAKGGNLSKSTIQLLLIARSLAHKPKLVLLEDPLEHLDEDQKDHILDFLFDESHNWTVVAVSSDVKLAKASTQIIVMEGGSIRETGVYADLNSKVPFKTTTHA